MDFGKPFTFVFEDPDWLKKLAMFALLGFANIIPGIGSLFMALVFAGVTVDIVRQVINKQSPVVPNLDIGRQFNDGLKLWVVNLVYGLPAIVLGILIAIVVGIGVGAGALAFNGESTDAAGVVIALVWIIISCIGLLMFVYGIILAILTPEIYARFAQTGSIKDSINFREVFRKVFKKPGPYLLAFVGVALLGIVGGIATSILSSIGAIALGIGALFGAALGSIYMSLGMGHFYGQAHNLASEEII